MTSFKYAAKGPGGKTVEGHHRRPTTAARPSPSCAGRTWSSCKRRARSSRQGGPRRRRRLGTGLFTPRRQGQASTELVLFTRQLATMVGAGLSLLEALEVLAEQAETPGLSATCEQLSSELRGGSDLSGAMEHVPQGLHDALRQHGHAPARSPARWTSSSSAWPTTWRPAEELQREIKSAMTYPVISLVLVLGITAFLMIGIVPGFRQVFDALGCRAAGADDVRARHLRVACGPTGAALRRDGRRRLRPRRSFKKTEAGALMFDRLTPAARRSSARCSARSRWRASARTFATLIRSGVPIMAHAGHRRRHRRQPGRRRRRARRRARACATATCSPSRSGQSQGLPADGGAHDRDRRAHRARSRRCWRRSPSSTTARSRPRSSR